MFERFTDRARRVIVLAQEESRLLSHEYISPDHILLGLIHEDEGVAARALHSQEVSLLAAREHVEKMLGRGTHDLRGHIPFTPSAKKVLERAYREALKLGHSYIGTEHLLLALIEEDGTAVEVLRQLEVDFDDLRLRVYQIIGHTHVPSKKQLIIDCNALGLQTQVDMLHGWREQFGEDSPEYQLGLARFLEMAARRFRKSAKSTSST